MTASITRNTAVVSISLPQMVAAKLDTVCRQRGQTRSALIASLIEKEAEDSRWQRIYRNGQDTAKRMKITSEEDINRILHAS